MYKLRFYKLSGVDKGKIDHEEFFETKEEMHKRYKEVFVYDRFSLNPTAWKRTENGWERMFGY